MKNAFLALALTLITSTSFSQGWLDLGFKGGWGPTILMNGNIWDDANYNHTITSAGMYGVKLGLNFNDHHQVTFDFMMGKFRQGFKHNVTDTTDGSSPEYTSFMSYKKMDFHLMYRHNLDGRYFEVGPTLSLLKEPTRTDTYNNIGAPTFAEEHINPSLMGMSLGFGSYMIGSENFGVTAGARITYMFNDIISASGKEANFPTLTTYETYKASTPLFVQLIFEANFDFAYVAKAQCGKRKLLTF